MIKEAVELVFSAAGKGPHEKLLVGVAMQCHLQLHNCCKPAPYAISANVPAHKSCFWAAAAVTYTMHSRKWQHAANLAMLSYLKLPQMLQHAPNTAAAVAAAATDIT